jgi:imidazolonepropionase-like amidohydrolase
VLLPGTRYETADLVAPFSLSGKLLCAPDYIFASACLLYFGAACSSASNGSSTPTASTTPTATVEASATPSFSPDSPTPKPDALILRNGTLISGTGADPVPNGHVVVEGDRIVSVGSGEPPVPPGAKVIDAQGGTIMPGLIDSHVHVARGIFAGEPGTIEPGGLMPWLSAGMTTLRDVGTPPGAFPQVKQMADGETAAHNAPRIVWAGPLVTAVGGYPFPVPRYASVGEAVASADEARQLVSSLADNGAGVIKLGLEQGYYGNLGWPLLPVDIMRAITETVHARGLRVTAHVTSLDEVRLALDGGVDDLAHAPLEAIPDEMMQEMLSRGTGLATTATVWDVASASARPRQTRSATPTRTAM